MRRRPKRLGKEESVKRAALISAAEQILVEQGHAALTARYLEEKSGIKYQSIYYYFKTLDDLLVEVLKKAEAEILERILSLSETEHPLTALWDYHVAPNISTELFSEFMAMAKDNERIREALATLSDEIRERETAVLSRYLDRMEIDLGIAAEELAVLLASVARSLRMERTIGMAGGHAKIEERIGTWLTSIQSAVPAPTNSAPVPPTTPSPISPLQRSQDAISKFVQRVQIALMMKGYDPGPADGDLSPKTQEALKAFQTANQLSISGNFDVDTLSALGVLK